MSEIKQWEWDQRLTHLAMQAAQAADCCQRALDGMEGENAEICSRDYVERQLKFIQVYLRRMAASLCDYGAPVVTVGGMDYFGEDPQEAVEKARAALAEWDRNATP